MKNRGYDAIFRNRETSGLLLVPLRRSSLPLKKGLGNPLQMIFFWRLVVQINKL